MASAPDIISGGAGPDSIFASDGQIDLIICGDGKDRVVIDPLDIVNQDCEVAKLP
ncbi:MAG TPA: hypothetical protein VFV58_04050 [Blastocatellia bacterium]|nr:hypothetical protein [Blastocatellia bacterium]